MQRSQAMDIVNTYVQNQGLIRHMLAVEAAMQDYARVYGQDPEEWGLAGLLHDFDWEIHPNMEEHPALGAPILRELGVPEKIVRCILSHGSYIGVSRESLMEKCLYAVDELTGLISAATLVRPSRSIHDLKIKSVRKKWKDTRFAASVDREQIEQGAADLGIELNDHIANVIRSMQRIASDLGLNGDPADQV
ncbi:MAG: HDIG domain-containing protein [Anaerolineales bacterium]|nr:HDIG domain-containing protein [Anaerolineales bacterium]